MNYRKLNHSFSPFLNNTIHAIYQLDSVGKARCYKTLPSGIIGLTLLLSGKGWHWEDDEWKSIPVFTTYGMIKKPGIIKTSPDCIDLSIGFKPLFMSSFLKHPMSIISDRFTNAEEVFLKDDLEKLLEKVLLAKNDFEKIKAIEEFLMKYYIGKTDPGLHLASQKIAKNHYKRVDELSAELNLTTRTLLNKFQTSIGLSPKEFMKIHRVNSALNEKVQDVENLTDMAYKLGYYDQAHFIHEFKEILGISPQKYFGNKELISDFYNFERWTLD